MKIAERALAVHERLLEFYGYPEWRNRLPPLDELVSTVLSQNTNDLNQDRGFNALKERFPTWEEVRDADTEKVIEAIRPAGLANQKGPRIQNILKEITQQCGQLDLEFLKDTPPLQASEWLMQFKGVGPKTAAIVLQFSLDMPAFPVDTHIYRITGRIGLRPKKMNVVKTHQHMESLLPKDTFYPAHLNLIRLGREICQARRSKCSQCPLQELCDFRAANPDY